MPHTIRPLIPADAAQLDAFLQPHAVEAYYLRSNALAGGLTYEGKYLQAEYFGAFRGDRLVGVIAYSWLDTILAYVDEPGCLETLTNVLVPSIQKRSGIVKGFLGLADQMNRIIETLNIPADAFREDDPSALYAVSLNQLRMPTFPLAARVRRAEETDRAQLIAWRIAFNIESLGATPGPELEKEVQEEIDRRLSIGEFFVLEKGEALLSFCGIGGHLPEARMIGPVWTPPELRNQGYARAVTAGALKLLANESPELKQAALFASKPDAVHVYMALGFNRLADWRFGLLKEDYSVAC